MIVMCQECEWYFDGSGDGCESIFYATESPSKTALEAAGWVDLGWAVLAYACEFCAEEWHMHRLRPQAPAASSYYMDYDAPGPIMVSEICDAAITRPQADSILWLVNATKNHHPVLDFSGVEIVAAPFFSRLLMMDSGIKDIGVFRGLNSLGRRLAIRAIDNRREWEEMTPLQRIHVAVAVREAVNGEES